MNLIESTSHDEYINVLDKLIELKDLRGHTCQEGSLMRSVRKHQGATICRGSKAKSFIII